MPKHRNFGVSFYCLVQNHHWLARKAPAGEDSSRTSPGPSVRTLNHTLLAWVLAPSLTNPQYPASQTLRL